MAIIFTSIDTPRPILITGVLRALIERVVNEESFKVGDLSIAFCSDSYIREQNVKFLNHDYETDILTFSYSNGKIISGDLLISVQTVLSNAELYAVTYLRELNRVVVHGILHLIGYDDTTEELQKIMRQREDFYLDLLDKEVEPQIRRELRIKAMKRSAQRVVANKQNVDRAGNATKKQNTRTKPTTK